MPSQKRADAAPIQLPPKPVVLSPSGAFDGDDGKWSTFVINIAGDGEGKGQNFKVLISTSSPLALVPAQTEWCTTSECAQRRGILDAGSLGFNSESSASKKAGIYTLPVPYWWSPGLLLPSTNETWGGEWSTTTVGLGAASKQSITMPTQYVAKYYFMDFFLGSLGLSVGSVNPGNTPEKTFLSTMVATNTIASNSYGFTAGAIYRNGGLGVTGNMVFGGYDISRINWDQRVSISMPNKQNNTLVVGVNSILYETDQDVKQGVESLSGTTGAGFSAVIDSTLPYLVLPDNICDKFVEKFNLGFDRDTGLYTINSTAHTSNQQLNATVSFKISSPQAQDSTTYSDIRFPYDAFSLEATDPIYPNKTLYFPIRKSSNGNFILGRTFLQEAYIIVDYERANFTVAPAIFTNPMPTEKLLPIYNTTYNPPTQAPKPEHDGLSGGAIAGIVIGIVAVFILLGGGAWLYYKRRRAANATTGDHEGKPSGIETIDAGGEVKHRRVSELTGSEAPISPKIQGLGYYGGDHKSIPELSPDNHPAELYSPPLDGSGEPDYFAGPKPRRRGATRDSSGQVTPGTPVAELPGEDAANPMQRPKHSRGPSDNSLSTNIDEVLAGRDKDVRQVQRKHSSKFVEHTGEGDGPSRADMVVSPLESTRIDEAEPTAESTVERRPSHTRGLSDTTIQSDSTAVSQPTPDELERWARSVDNAPTRS
jgi:hypothetical protein